MLRIPLKDVWQNVQQVVLLIIIHTNALQFVQLLLLTLATNLNVLLLVQLILMLTLPLDYASILLTALDLLGVIQQARHVSVHVPLTIFQINLLQINYVFRCVLKAIMPMISLKVVLLNVQLPTKPMVLIPLEDVFRFVLKDNLLKT